MTIEVGLLPKEWKIAKVSEIAEFSKKPRGIRISSDNKTTFISMEKISEYERRVKGWEVRKHKSITSGTFVFRNDLIVAKITPSFENGKQAILDNLPEDFAVATTEVWALHPKDNRKFIIDHLYNFLKLPQLRRQLASKMEGSTGRQRLPRHVLENLEIPLPPLPEQKAITHVLQTIQEAKEGTEEVIRATKELKKSMMKHLFTVGPVSSEEAERETLKETEIGMMPEDWEVVKLGEVVDIVYGVQAAVAHLTDRSIGIPILTNINITNEGALDTSTLRYYSLPEKKRERLKLRKGDVLFNWRSGSQSHVGKTALFNLDGDFTFSSFILRFRPSERLSSTFLHHFLNYLKVQGYFSKNRDQSSVNSVFNASLSAKIPIYVPPSTIQDEISGILRSIDVKIEAEENKKNALEGLFKTLLHDLMTAKIRVNNLPSEA